MVVKILDVNDMTPEQRKKQLFVESYLKPMMSAMVPDLLDCKYYIQRVDGYCETEYITASTKDGEKVWTADVTADSPFAMVRDFFRVFNND